MLLTDNPLKKKKHRQEIKILQTVISFFLQITQLTYLNTYEFIIYIVWLEYKADKQESRNTNYITHSVIMCTCEQSIKHMLILTSRKH